MAELNGGPRLWSLHLDLVPGGKELVEAQNEFGVTLKQSLDTLDDAFCVDSDERKYDQGRTHTKKTPSAKANGQVAGHASKF